jgi:hypothetical protein
VQAVRVPKPPLTCLVSFRSNSRAPCRTKTLLSSFMLVLLFRQFGSVERAQALQKEFLSCRPGDGDGCKRYREGCELYLNENRPLGWLAGGSSCCIRSPATSSYGQTVSSSEPPFGKCVNVRRQGGPAAPTLSTSFSVNSRAPMRRSTRFGSF